MSAVSAFSGITETVGPWISAGTETGANRLDMETTADRLLPAVTALSGLRWGYLSAITGFDSGPAARIRRVRGAESAEYGGAV